MGACGSKCRCWLLYIVSLDVQSNSPAVIGSVVTFRAALCKLNHSLLNESFVYYWINDAVNQSTGIFDITTTIAGTVANMSKVFSVHVLPGQYLMEVRVFRKVDFWHMAFRHLSPVAVGFHNFSLTGILWCFVFIFWVDVLVPVLWWFLSNVWHLYSVFIN